MSKRFGRLGCLFLAIILVFSLAACGAKKDSGEDKTEAKTEDTKKEEPKKEEPEPYVKGTVEGNHFESEWLNMKADFSEDYVMATEEEIAQMQSAGSEILMGEEGQEKVDKAQEAGVMTNEMMVASVNGVPNSTVAVEKLTLANMTAEQYLDATEKQLLASMTEEVQISISAERPAVTIAGEDYLCLMASVTVSGVSMESYSYVRIKDGYAVVINTTFTTDTEQQKDELLAMFQPLK